MRGVALFRIRPVSLVFPLLFVVVLAVTDTYNSPLDLSLEGNQVNDVMIIDPRGTLTLSGTQFSASLIITRSSFSGTQAVRMSLVDVTVAGSFQLSNFNMSTSSVAHSTRSLSRTSRSLVALTTRSSP